jgi:MFS family permease
MVASVSSTLLCVSVYGPSRGWTSPLSIITLTTGVLLALIFLRWESVAKEPILPLYLFKNHTFNITSILGFIIGAGMFGALIMLPLYLQVVKGDSPSAAGLKLIPLMLGIVTSSIFSGKYITKHGKYKRFPIVGTVLLTIGILLMTTLGIDTPYWQLSIYAVLIGLGMGLSMQTLVIALQNSIDFKDMGVATTSNTFFRSLGSVFGAAVFGSILTNRVGHYLQSDFAKLAQTNPTALKDFDPGILESVTSNTSVLQGLPGVIQNTVLQSFVNSFHVVFMVAAPVPAVGFICAMMLRDKPLRSNAQYQQSREDAAGDAIG